ncbi:cobD/Cbib family protein [Mycobacterium avium subsp. avium 2285 (R)]|nr:cobD/Cbib family protein [Mycobacterium avium subsp. avium 2285 (R)]
MLATHPVGVLIGYLADRALGDPRRGHPVALFGRAAAGLENLSYRDGRVAGALHVAVSIGAVGLLGLAVHRAAARAGPRWSIAATAAAGWVCSGGSSLTRTGLAMAELLQRGDVDAARRLLPSLCGRDPAALDAAGLARAALESVAENTSDAQVAPLLWAAAGGVPAVLAYRGINTLDAMIGHRSPRYLRFGWAAAKLDDIANYPAARVTASLTVLLAPVVGGSRRARRGPGAATPPAIPAPTPAWWRRRSPGRWACGWAGPPSTGTSCRSGRRSAPAASPR